MKKCLIIVSVLIFILVLSVYSFASDIPAPFGKAKQMALKCSPDQDGRHLLFIEDKTTGRIFMVGYLSGTGYIGIGYVQGGDVVAVEFCEKTDTFTFYYGGTRQVIDQTKAIGMAFSVFRELVTKKLI